MQFELTVTFSCIGGGEGLTGLKGSAPPQHINVDNNARFRYLDDYWFLYYLRGERDTQSG
jgi:hypothetical protein